MLRIKSVRLNPETGRVYALLARIRCPETGKERNAYFVRLDEEPCTEGVPPGRWMAADEVLIDV